MSLADLSGSKHSTIDILIGADYYQQKCNQWKINKFIAAEPLLGWNLTGYYDKISKTINFNATHMFRVNSEICEHSNNDYKTLKSVLNYDSKQC